MQLLQFGDGVQPDDWKVRQADAAGYCRVYFIKSGEITYCDDRTERSLVPGKLYVFPSQQLYNISHNPEKPINCLWFHMDMFPYDIDRLLEFDFSKDVNRTMGMILDALDNEYKRCAGQDEIYLSLTGVLAQFITRHPSVKSPDAELLEILGYIRNNAFSHQLTVGSVSGRFGYSTAHFIRTFRKWMNTTPHKYIAGIRLAAAARMLSEGESVSKTAAMCGYADIKTFAKAFKNLYGVAPSEHVKFYKSQA